MLALGCAVLRRRTGEREAALRVEQEDEGRHRQSSCTMGHRSSVLRTGFAAYAGTQSARKGVRGIRTLVPQRAAVRQVEWNVIPLCCARG
jgi:hypothetical protein